MAFIKINIEGSGLETMKALKRTLRTQRPMMLCEILPVYSADNSFRMKRQEEVETVVAKEEYGIYRIQKVRGGRLGGLMPIQTIGVHSDSSQCQYFFVPKENVQQVFSVL